ncbi:MAG: 2-oxoglutarate dehydrogenase E1 component [Chlamydiales bacterium]|nr:2-oxoglutarate dehydrogenase E1 component [Chlamydiales bacterium]
MRADDLTELGCANPALLEEMYLKFQADPVSVDPSWREILERYDDNVDREVAAMTLKPEVHYASEGSAGDLRIADLIAAYRTYGHLLANTNPIATKSTEEPRELLLSAMGFREEELSQLFPTAGLLPAEKAPLSEIVDALRQIYCRNVGVEYMGLQMPEMEVWLQQHIEPTRFQVELSIEDKKQILDYLNRSEFFESFLHTKYVGQKRFSVEGGETIIPMLNAIIEKGASLGLEEFVLGMAHRGRLNVLCNILHKSYAEIFSEFEEGYIPDSFEGSGDVKYHRGFEADYATSHGQCVKISLTPNPSHLEAVGPVVEGQVRARQILRNEGDGKDKVLPLVIHGDASIAGQGVVYETMQLYRLPGYDNGGTVHIIINNQIGFTTLPKDARSTRYCSDIARTFSAPVFHVNAEDPEGCIYATMLAVELRYRFHCDVFVELNCYRKYGHNEGDEPAFTQPLEYAIIRKKSPIREIYRDQLVSQGVLERHLAEAAEEEFRTSLNKIKQAIEESIKKAASNQTKKEPKFRPRWDPFIKIDTSVDIAEIRQVAERFCAIPEDFTIHPKLKRLLEDRLAMVSGAKDAPGIDWGMGEHLALATLLWEGHHVRLSGQDSRRGTFSHRHAMWMDQVRERKYFPLSHLKPGQGRFDVFNSPLSEYAALGFEYGYALSNPKALVAWEAQFGDFCNGAQIIIDQFMAPGEQKWGLHVPLVLLLPHGYEGQGPEHSSARMERFLQLCGDLNMQIVDPTTPAQLFHLLRRQVLMTDHKPLVVFTPKGLLRHPRCVSKLSDFTSGSFQEIIDDPLPPKNVDKVVFCCGRVYYDLLAAREEDRDKNVALIRIEQLYPLNSEKLKTLIEKYAKTETRWMWVQEEPSNMGAWKYIRHRLRDLLPTQHDPEYIGRGVSASPATGSHALHKRETIAILEAVFGEKHEPRHQSPSDGRVD